MNTREKSDMQSFANTASIMGGLLGLGMGIKKGREATEILKYASVMTLKNIRVPVATNFRGPVLAAYGAGGYFLGGTWGGMIGLFTAMYLGNKNTNEESHSNRFNRRYG